MDIILFLRDLSALGMVISLIIFLYSAFDWKILIKQVYQGDELIHIHKIIPIDKQAKFIILKARNKLIIVFVSKDYAKLIYEIDYEVDKTIT